MSPFSLYIFSLLIFFVSISWSYSIPPSGSVLDTAMKHLHQLKEKLGSHSSSSSAPIEGGKAEPNCKKLGTGHPLILPMTNENFDEYLSYNSLVAVAFYVPWAPEMDRFLEMFAEFARDKYLSRHFLFGTVDCSTQYTLRNNFNVQFFPTIKIFKQTKPILQILWMGTQTNPALSSLLYGLTYPLIIEATNAEQTDHILSISEIAILVTPSFSPSSYSSSSSPSPTSSASRLLPSLSSFWPPNSPSEAKKDGWWWELHAVAEKNSRTIFTFVHNMTFLTIPQNRVLYSELLATKQEAINVERERESIGQPTNQDLGVDGVPLDPLIQIEREKERQRTRDEERDRERKVDIFLIQGETVHIYPLDLPIRSQFLANWIVEHYISHLKYVSGESLMSETSKFLVQQQTSFISRRLHRQHQQKLQIQIEKERERQIEKEKERERELERARQIERMMDELQRQEEGNKLKSQELLENFLIRHEIGEQSSVLLDLGGEDQDQKNLQNPKNDHLQQPNHQHNDHDQHKKEEIKPRREERKWGACLLAFLRIGVETRHLSIQLRRTLYQVSAHFHRKQIQNEQSLSSSSPSSSSSASSSNSWFPSISGSSLLGTTTSSSSLESSQLIPFSLSSTASVQLLPFYFTDGERFAAFARKLGIPSSETFGSIAIIDFDSEQHYTLSSPTGNFSQEQIIEFINQFFNGSLQQEREKEEREGTILHHHYHHYDSDLQDDHDTEPSQAQERKRESQKREREANLLSIRMEEKEGYVRSLNQSTFYQIVFQSPPTDVLVNFHQSWCGFSKLAYPNYIKLGERLSLVKHFIVADYDVSNNPLPLSLQHTKLSTPIENFPTLVFFPSVEKDEPIVYKGFLEFEDIFKWIQTVATVELAPLKKVRISISDSEVEDLVEQLGDISSKFSG